MEPQTKRDTTTRANCQRGSGQPQADEKDSRAGCVGQLLALTGALEERRVTWAQRAQLLRLEEAVKQPGDQLWRLHQCLVHMDSIALQLFDYYQQRDMTTNMAASQQVKAAQVTESERWDKDVSTASM